MPFYEVVAPLLYTKYRANYLLSVWWFFLDSVETSPILRGHRAAHTLKYNSTMVNNNNNINNRVSGSSCVSDEEFVVIRLG